METKRVKKTKGKCLATGYKIFTSDWGNKQNSYIYGTDNDIKGTIHKVSGNIEQCRWGLHFCPNPLDCYKYYEPCQWNKFAKVEAYDQLIDNGDKYVTNMLKIVETYTFQEFIKEIKEYNSSISDGSGISDGYGISYGSGLKNCEGCKKTIFCINFTGKLAIFNKSVNEKRFYEVWNKIQNYDWYPKFNNAYDLKETKCWEKTDATKIVRVDEKEAWSKMPKGMVDYIKSLPEFDKTIFKEITGIC